MTDQAHKAEQFRALHIPGKPVVLFNIWDAGGAKAVALGGAKAIATGSWSVANANGFADGERIPLALAIDNLRRIVGATQLPVTVDLESGYGDTPEMVGETIALAIEAGAVGCNLEDSFRRMESSARESIMPIASGALARPPMQPTCASSSTPGLISFSSDRLSSMTMLWSLRRSIEHTRMRRLEPMDSSRPAWRISF